jgi:hypothetical protein
MDKLQPYANGNNWQNECKDFTKELSMDPKKSEIRINKFADGSKYLPIQVVEDKLTLTFNGLWQTRDFIYQVIVNELVGSIELGVFHPVLGQWLWYAGTGSVIIQQKAEYEVKDGKRVKKEVDVLDVSKKIANTLTKDMGHLKAECVKNAAKSLGRFFGGSLNRREEDGEYNPINEVPAEDIMSHLIDIDNLHDLGEYYKSLPKSSKTRRIEQLFKDKAAELGANV